MGILAESNFSILLFFPVAEQAGLSITWAQAPKFQKDLSEIWLYYRRNCSIVLIYIA